MAIYREGSSGLLTITQREQLALENKVSAIFGEFASLGPRQRSVLLELWREEHVNSFLLKGLRRLGSAYSALDSSRPWLCYWILHSLALLGEEYDAELEDDVIDFLGRCQDARGGYGGGPGQMPHLATTYAAVCALVTLGSPKALGSINRDKIFQFLTRMKDSKGGFRLHEGGEMDVRGCYTAVAVAHILDILTPTLKYKVNEFVISCQTYEGGIGGEPGAEAHGGYTFCGLAALILIDEVDGLDLANLIKWAASRQGKVEGGFQGRTNKLVDGCYSFWQGGIFPLIQHVVPQLMSQVSGFLNHPLQDVKHVQGKKTGCTFADSTYFQAYDKETPIKSDSNVETTRPLIHTSPQPMNSAEKLFPPSNSRSASLYHSPYQKIKDPQALSLDCNSEKGKSQAEARVSSMLEQDGFLGPLFGTEALQAYILLCCQVLEGGLIDKPGKSRDFYHTCYCLSGLSTAQHPTSLHPEASPLEGNILGPYSNLLEPTHPLCNVHFERYLEARNFFKGLPFHAIAQ